MGAGVVDDDRPAVLQALVHLPGGDVAGADPFRPRYAVTAAQSAGLVDRVEVDDVPRESVAEPARDGGVAGEGAPAEHDQPPT